MRIEPQALLTILGMALVTYATRAGGLWLMGRVGISGRIDAWLRYVPGAVLVSLIAPSVMSGGAPTMIAGLATAGVAIRTGNALTAMIVGVLVVVVMRMLL